MNIGNDKINKKYKRQGFKDSRIQGSKGSRIQGSKDLRFQGSKGSGVKGYRVKINAKSL